MRSGCVNTMFKIINLYIFLLIQVLNINLCKNELNFNHSFHLNNNIFIPKKFDYDWTYHNLTEINIELTRIAKIYSNITKLISLGTTSEDRDINAVIISKKLIKGKVVVFECGIHAREWISVSFCLWSINKLIHDNSLLQYYQFLIIPVLNSDGYWYSWETDRRWRKNRHRSIGKCFGIDINRNWKTSDFCTINANHEPCDERYCGDEPFASAEAAALSGYLLDHRKDLYAYFSIHSFSQLWMYPRSYQNDSVPNASILAKLSEIGVNAIKRVNGTQYKFGVIYNTLYPASGTSVDWVYDTLEVKIAFVIELPDQGEHGFLLPANRIRPVCEETWAGIEAVLQYSVQNHSLASNSLSIQLIIIIVIINSLLFSVQ